MNGAPRPLLLGYIRAEMLTSAVELPTVEAELETFATREDFCLGTIYVEKGHTPGAFHELMAELDRDETAIGVVVPGVHHLTSTERQILSACQYGAGLAFLVAHVGRSGPPLL